MKNCGSVFIIGNPRSGTSLFRLMMTNHQNICIPPECGFIQWLNEKYKNIKADEEIGIVDHFIADLADSRKIETWNLDFIALKTLILEEKPSCYADYCKLVIQQYANQNYPQKNLTYVGDKNNYYVNHLDLLASIFPDAFFVFIFRDPRDVVCSYMDFVQLKSDSPYVPKLPDNIREIIKGWMQNAENILSFASKLKSEKQLTVKFEDFILDPEKELRKVCEKMSLPFDSDMLNYYLHNDEPELLMDWKQKTLTPPDKSVVGRYKRILSNDQISEIEKGCRNMLVKLGYNYG